MIAAFATVLLCLHAQSGAPAATPPAPRPAAPRIVPPTAPRTQPSETPSNAPKSEPVPPATSQPLAPPIGFPTIPSATPSETPGATPSTTPGATPVAAPEGSAEDAFVGPLPPRFTWIFVDRWKEFGGWIVRETDNEITVCDGTETRTFGKAQVQDIVELIPPKPGQRGTIQLRDGALVRGVILRDDLEGVGFQVDKLVAKLPRSQVYRVILHPDFEERYATFKANTFPEQHGRRLALCQWLIDEARLDLALQELEALVRDSDSDEARDLLRSVRAQIKLAESTAADKLRTPDAKKHATNAPTAPTKTPAVAKDTTPSAADPPSSDPPAVPANTQGDAPSESPTDAAPALPAKSPTSAGPPNPREILPKDLLSDDDVNLIRVYEIDSKDPPRLRVQPEGVRQLLLRYGSSSLLPATTQERNALYSKDAVELARLFFDLKARDLYRYIEVQEDPPSLARFRTRVHNSWMIPNCATSRCHGGVQAGEFFLYTGNAKDARVRYTNLMTLLTFTADGKKVVDFDTPVDSLLIQYAMPRNMARTPHPDVKGWKPVFSQGTPQLLEDTVEWIRGMYQPRPEYPVNYKAPKLKAPDKAVQPVDGPDR